MKHLLSLILALMAFGLQAAVPAQVTAVSAKVKSSPTLRVSCTLNGQAASLVMDQAGLFAMKMAADQASYDGKTQWTYVAKDKEVTLTNPTAQELAETNPLQILGKLDKLFQGTKLKDGRVRLTPLQKGSEIAEVTVKFDSKTGWPTDIRIVGANGSIDMKTLKFTVEKKRLPQSSYQFKAPKGTKVIDFR